MELKDRLLYWFREPFLTGDIACLCQETKGCSELVPVFCFDQREENLMTESDSRFKVQQVARLRDDLKSRGSNLLVVYNSYEIIIPSLARVLKVGKVLSHPLALTSPSDEALLHDFREAQLKEVGHLLNMHSIDLKINNSKNLPDWMPLPVFPAINPGQIRF